MILSRGRVVFISERRIQFFLNIFAVQLKLTLYVVMLYFGFMIKTGQYCEHYGEAYIIMHC